MSFKKVLKKNEEDSELQSTIFSIDNIKYKKEKDRKCC